MNTSTAIAIHLLKRPFAPILEQSGDKTNPLALQLMCIIDYYMEESSLYSRIAQLQSPKLLVQLMKFHSFAAFKYYDYRANRIICNKILQCKFCDLHGSYPLILTHMAVNHNVHIGLKFCTYCNNRNELKTHFNDYSLDHCYKSYIRKHEITKNDEFCEIVTNFYGMIKKIAEKLFISVIRNHGYAGIGFKTVEKMSKNYGQDFSNDCVVNRETRIKS